MAFRRDSAELPLAHRCDRIDVAAADLLPPVRQADGSLLVSGFVARPGVLSYQRADGSIQRELVRADELARSAAGIARKSLTLEHPDEPVSPENVATVGVGDVGSRVRVIEDTGYIQVDMVIRRQDGLDAFAGGVQELSPGYACRLDATPGVDPVFGPYDAIQVDREYNHLALCSRARGGPTIRARADRADSAIQILPSPSESPVKLLLLAAPLLTRVGVLAGKPVRLDADGTPDLASAAEALASLEASAPAAAAAVATAEQMKKDLDTLRATLAAKEAELAALTGAPAPSPAEMEAEMEAAAEMDPMLDAKGEPVALPAAMPPGDACAPVRMDALGRIVRKIAKERADLEALGKGCRLDSAAVAKMGNAKLRKEILKKTAPHARQDGSRDYDRALLDALATRRTDSDPSADPYAPLRNVGEEQPEVRTDAAEPAFDRFQDAFDRRHGRGKYATATA